MSAAQHWFWSGDSLWWVGRDPPPGDGPAPPRRFIVELRRDDAEDALALVDQLFAEDRGAEVGPLLQAVLPGLRLEALSRMARHQLLALLIARRELRIWQAWTLHEMTSDSGLWGVLPPPPAGNAPRRTGRPPPPGAAPSPPAGGGGGGGGSGGGGRPFPAADPTERKVWYEFALLDELGDGLPNVEVQLTTPGGSHALTTNAAGVVRIHHQPPASGSARVDLDSLAVALAGRFDRPRRRSRPPPEGPRFNVVTPARAGRDFSLDAEEPHRVMVVSRTDLVVAGADSRWHSLEVAEDSQPLCGYVAEELRRLHLCSRGRGETAQVDAALAVAAIEPPDGAARAARAAATPAIYVVRPGDSLAAIAARLLADPMRWPEIRTANLDLLRGRPVDLIHPGDRLQIPVAPVSGLIPDPDPWPPIDVQARRPFLDLDVDSLHEALFDGLGGSLFDSLTGPLQTLPPPPGPAFETAQPAAQAAALLAAVTSIETGLPLDVLFAPVDLPEFDPVEHAGPPRG